MPKGIYPRKRVAKKIIHSSTYWYEAVPHRKSKKRIPNKDRFWSRVKKTETCWLWLAGKGERGHGFFTVRLLNGRYRHVMAHRYAYGITIGAIPEGYELHHKCENPSCVNPTHVEPLPPSEHILRGNTLTAQNARKTHCKNGHEFTVENTRLRGHKRSCRICDRAFGKTRTENARRARECRA
jgi:hypothetical protein